MKYSTNFNMNKPELNEQYSLSHWNDNTDIIDTEMQAIRSGTDEVMKATLLNFCYPIGSLYWSSKSTNPASLFGGTWVQIKDKFVLACGDTYTSSGSTGGASSVTLSVSNMPSHTHSFTPSGMVSSHSHGLNGHTHSFSGSASHSHDVIFSSSPSTNFVYYFEGQQYGARGNSAAYGRAEEHSNATGSIITNSSTVTISGTTGGNSGSTANATPTFTGNAGTTESNGSGTSFSILPPYVVKYCWERTA